MLGSIREAPPFLDIPKCLVPPSPTWHIHLHSQASLILLLNPQGLNRKILNHLGELGCFVKGVLLSYLAMKLYPQP